MPVGLCADGVCPNEELISPKGIVSLKENTSTPEIYGLFEVDVRINASYANPFDYDDIRLEADFISPAGDEFKIEGFIYSVETAGRSNKIKGNEIVDALWKLRFSPDVEGIWKYSIRLISQDGIFKSEGKEFECLASLNPGFIRVCPYDNKYFEFSNGKFYYPVGENISWASLNNFRKYFKALHEAGGNWARVWMSNWEVALEWTGGRYEGLGYYNLKAADKLDKIIDMAKENQLYIQLVLNHHGQLSTRVNPQWAENPYNAKNGGPCKDPQDFFTNEEAKELYKNRMRYIVARWGYSPNILCWEMWNELTFVDNLTADIEVDWHREMAAYIKELDANRHLVSTSYAGSFYEKSFNKELWQLADMDFTQFHMYSPDAVEVVNGAWRAMKVFDKPYIFAEIGRGSADGVDEEDKEARNLHAAMWAQFMTPAGGNAMCWWWDTHIHPNNLYYHWQALTNYAGNLDRRLKDFRLSTAKLRARRDDKEIKIYAQAILNNQQAYIWVYDLAETKYDPELNTDSLISEAEVEIENLNPGSYVAELWNTYSGKITSVAEIKTTDGKIKIELPPFKRDMALKVLAREIEDLNIAQAGLLGPRETIKEKDKKAFKVKKVRRIKVDGSLKDWKLKKIKEPYVVVFDKDSSYFTQKGAIKTDEDLSAKIYFAYNSDYLYIAAIINDDSVLSRQQGIDIWRDDCLEVWLDANNDATEFNNMPFNPGCFQINIAPGNDEKETEVYVYRNFNITDLKNNIIAASSMTETGYIIEAAIPFESLGIEAVQGKEIGFNLSLVDRDKTENKWNHILLYGQKEEDATKWGILQF
jgi:hypothetical protein